jgi:hypothetical protein
MKTKPRYRYTSSIEEAIKKGDSARIFTEGHPVFGSTWIRTSTVVKYNKETKEIETRNSIYEHTGE